MEKYFYGCRYDTQAEKDVYRASVTPKRDTKKEADLALKEQRFIVPVASFFDKQLDKKDAPALERRLLKAFVSCNIPFNAVEDPRFVSLFKLL